jgi:hypothetical protein
MSFKKDFNIRALPKKCEYLMPADGGHKEKCRRDSVTQIKGKHYCSDHYPIVDGSQRIGRYVPPSDWHDPMHPRFKKS